MLQFAPPPRKLTKSGLFASTFFTLALLLAPSAIGQEIEQPFCDLPQGEPEQCITEDFTQSVSGKKYSQYQSPMGFDFEQIHAPPGAGSSLNIDDYNANLGHVLFTGCYSTLMTIPDPRFLVTIVFQEGSPGQSSPLNFVAYDSNYNVIDAKTVFGGPTPTPVNLGPGSAPISHVAFHHVGQVGISDPVEACFEEDEACWEPFISYVKACNPRTF